ncbi:MAG: FG-GAP repeat protein [Planctomycetota bacterium]
MLRRIDAGRTEITLPGERSSVVNRRCTERGLIGRQAGREFREAALALSILMTSLSVFSALSLLASPVEAQCGVTEFQELTASDGVHGDFFGDSVSISGNVALVGAFMDDALFDLGKGSAYVYRYDGNVWSEEHKLTASDGYLGSRFGDSVAVAGDVAVVGAPGSFSFDPGGAYVYRYNGSVWIEEQKLTASDLSGGFFGSSVAVTDDLVVVGAFGNSADAGAAYVYHYSSGTWVEEQKLTASLAGTDRFGYSVAAGAGRVVVGAPWDDDNGYLSGAVHVYGFDGTAWVEEQKLSASDAVIFDSFGWSVSMDGDIILVGTSHCLPWVGCDPGMAYIFRYNGLAWVEEQKLTASDGDLGDKYGRSVAVSGGVALLGAAGAEISATASGSAYVARHAGGTWVENQKLVTTGGVNFALGSSVSASGNWGIVGAQDVSPSEAAYVFPITPLSLTVEPTAVNPGDLITFWTGYGDPGDPVMLTIVNVNGSPVFIVAVVSAFDVFFKFELSAVVPPGFSGITATFKSYGIGRCGSVEATNEVPVSFL